MELSNPLTPPDPPVLAPLKTAEWLHRRLARLEWLFGLVFMGVVVLNFASAAGRYVLGLPIIGADEVQVYTMVWLIFMGAAIVGLRRLHLRMDVLVAHWDQRRALWRNALEALLTAATCGAVAWVSFGFAWHIHGMEQLSDAASIPMWIPHLSAGMGFGLMALGSVHSFAVFILQIKR
jgi:TRAP-type transport system small permease protein